MSRMRLFRLLLVLSLYGHPAIGRFRFAMAFAAAAAADEDEAERLEQMEQALTWGDSDLAQGDFPSAIRQYTGGVRQAPPSLGGDSRNVLLSLYTNRGTAFSAMGQEEEAVESYRAALLLVEQDDNVLSESTRAIVSQTAYFLGLSLQTQENYTQALDAYQKAADWDQLLWSAFANRASILYDHFQQYAPALKAYQTAFDLLTKGGGDSGGGIPPTDPPEKDDMPTILAELQYRMGLCIFHGQGTRGVKDDNGESYKCVWASDEDSPSSSSAATDCAQMAAHSFSRALHYNPNHEAATHMLATVTADATMTKASNTFITSLFDDYATNFEHSLVQELGYNGYERLRRVFDRAMASLPYTPPSVFPLVVDGGCGTGLVGEQFRNMSQTLVGIDLSAAILAQAQRLRPQLYDETHVGDITQVLDELKRVDLFVAADSLIYLGDLQDLFASLQRNVQSWVAFTLENVSLENEASLEKSRPDWRWQLTPSGRFAHRRAYVEEMATTHGFEVVRYEEMENFRQENGVGVRGHAFVLKKRRDDKEEL